MRRILLSLVTCAMVFGLVAPAAAAPPLQVKFVVPTTISNPNPSTFTATGLPEGRCSTGSTYTYEFQVLATGGPIMQAQMDKVFICGDGSGSFTLQLTATFGGNLPTSMGSWKVVAGSDQFAGARGQGYLKGYPTCGNDCVLDIYVGRLRTG